MDDGRKREITRQKCKGGGEGRVGQAKAAPETDEREITRHSNTEDESRRPRSGSRPKSLFLAATAAAKICCS